MVSACAFGLIDREHFPFAHRMGLTAARQPCEIPRRARGLQQFAAGGVVEECIDGFGGAGAVGPDAAGGSTFDPPHHVRSGHALTSVRVDDPTGVVGHGGGGRIEGQIGMVILLPRFGMDRDNEGCCYSR